MEREDFFDCLKLLCDSFFFQDQVESKKHEKLVRADFQLLEEEFDIDLSRLSFGDAQVLDHHDVFGLELNRVHEVCDSVPEVNQVNGLVFVLLRLASLLQSICEVFDGFAVELH